MSEVSIRDAKHAEQLFVALSEQLAARGEAHTIVVVGGSALIALGFVSRTTRDVDVVALLQDEELVSAEPLPDGLLAAVKLVADDFGLRESWLNSGPTSLLDFGLPLGFLARGERHAYGTALDVVFASRLDQIHFKLYAVVDRGGGRHLDDLQALSPTEAELLEAAEWSETHDTSAGYREVLEEVLAHFGVRREPA
ncbi:MAG: DUF6036 family nucleotidyltransferase [Solirubrobacteraceae bacterium]